MHVICIDQQLPKGKRLLFVTTTNHEPVNDNRYVYLFLRRLIVHRMGDSLAPRPNAPKVSAEVGIGKSTDEGPAS
jgi:hypothetical protein